MKKSFLILTSLLLIVFTSGCIKQKDTYAISIDKDNNVELSETFAVDKATFNALNDEFGSELAATQNSDSDQSQNYILYLMKKIRTINSFNIQDYSDDNYIGFTQTKKDIPLANIKTEYFMPGLTSVSETPVSITKGFFNDTYKIHLKYNYENAYDEINERVTKIQQEMSDQDYSPIKATHTFIDNKDGTFTVKDTYNQNGFTGSNSVEEIPNPDITLTIKIPTKAKNHNATRVVANNEYQWDLFVLNSDVDINLEYKKQSDNVPGIVMALSILLLLAIFGFIYYRNVNEASY